ncbi:unnamed protein product [Phytophthora lilii]|uniref:Unnamed protein product n=1 Tax=Phytophthora lilii TaxID=2077276 RepID=A0A9W6TX97_9STRA|nr:unnamed protein product [Phytophthora lilii]
MELVKPITSDHDLIKLADIIGVKLDSIIDVSEATKKLHKGVGPPTTIGDLPYNEFQYQGTYSDFCGIYCLLWIYNKQKNKPDLMKGFINLDIDAI